MCISHDSSQLIIGLIWRQAIQVINLVNGQTVQEIPIGSRPRNLYFTEDYDKLVTDIGVFTKTTDDGGDAYFVPVGYGVSVDHRWVTRNGHKVLWLPADYASYTTVVRGNVIGFACSTGDVLCLEFC